MRETIPTVIKGDGKSGAAQWSAANKDGVARALEASGAVLIRGFTAWTDSDFRVLVDAISGERPHEYLYR